MPNPRVGELFASRWEPEELEDPDAFRVFEIAAASADGYSIWLYRNSFRSPPRAVRVEDLRRVQLHDRIGGPVNVPLTEFATWSLVPVDRL